MNRTRSLVLLAFSLVLWSSSLEAKLADVTYQYTQVMDSLTGQCIRCCNRNAIWRRCCGSNNDQINSLQSQRLRNILNSSFDSQQSGSAYRGQTTWAAGWAGVGFRLPNSTYGGQVKMPDGDLYTSFWTFNETTGDYDVNVTDRYVPGKANTYPTSDTAIKNCTQDVIPGSVSGYQNQTGGPTGYGTSLFRFARKLNTGDHCDHPILNGTHMDVLYAIGNDNSWRIHYEAGMVQLPLIPSASTGLTSTSGDTTAKIPTGPSDTKDVDIAIAVGTVAVAIGLINVVIASIIWRRRQHPHDHKTEKARLLDAAPVQDN